MSTQPNPVYTIEPPPKSKYEVVPPQELPKYANGQQAKVGDIQHTPGTPIGNVNNPGAGSDFKSGQYLTQQPGETASQFVQRGAHAKVTPQEIQTEQAYNVRNAPVAIGTALTAGAVSPVGLAAAVSSPLAAAGALGGSYLGGKGAAKLTKVLGGGETAQNWAGLGGAVLGAGGGGKLGDMAQEAIPSAPRAGKALGEVRGTVGERPVPITDKLSDSTMRIKELADTGSTMPQAARKFLVRVTDPNKPPLTFAEARDFQSNISKLSADENMKLTPVMRRAVGQWAKDFGNTVSDTAEAGGQGPKFDDAMKEYAQAMRLRSVGSKALKAIGGATTAGAAYYGAKKIFGH
jgi:hypothetical protein